MRDTVYFTLPNSDECILLDLLKEISEDVTYFEV